MFDPRSNETLKGLIGRAEAKAVTAVSWQAGLSMRTAIQIQLRRAKIPSSKLLNAKDGIDYPLDEEELRWQLELACA